LTRLLRRVTWLPAALISGAAVACGTASPGTVVEDLTQRVDAADERRPAAESFSVREASIGGASRRAILARQSSRIVFRVAAPPRARLDAWIAVPEDVWPLASAGMLFRVLIQAESAEGPHQAYAKHLNPYLNWTDRAWHHVDVDLSPFAGQTIRLFLNTNFTPPADHDPNATPGLGLWGEPRIVVR
jgi:hypothetical protein